MSYNESDDKKFYGARHRENCRQAIYLSILCLLLLYSMALLNLIHNEDQVVSATSCLPSLSIYEGDQSDLVSFYKNFLQLRASL